MKILFISRIPVRGVSGGRYLSALFAERLARGGHEVEYWVNYNNALIFPVQIMKTLRLRKYFPLVLGRNGFFDQVLFRVYRIIAKRLFKKAFDHVVIVPEEGSVRLHEFFYDIANAIGTKVHLLNFETPNWFNSLAPVKRDPARWDGWGYIADRAESVISISKTSDSYAQMFYGYGKEYRWFEFPVFQESDLIPLDWDERENAAVCISRMDPHKGLDGLLEFISNAYGLKTFHLVIGSMKLDEYFLQMLVDVSNKNCINLQIHKKISHHDKFRLLGSVKYLVFPTYFEGLGMPPIEALASGCKVAAFELPVLREISAHIEFAVPGNFKELSSIVSLGLDCKPPESSTESVSKYEIDTLVDFI